MTPNLTPPPDVSLAVFVAAIQTGATHLSTDGRHCYFSAGLTPGGAVEVYVSEWVDSLEDFGPWEIIDELPAEAVEMP